MDKQIIDRAIFALRASGDSDIAAELTQAIHSLQSQSSSVVRVCPTKDSVCGDNPQNWCASCPLQSREAEPVGHIDPRHLGSPLAQAATIYPEPWESSVPVYAKPIEAQEAVPVGEIVNFGELKEVSWKKGTMPPFGAKLYTTQPPKAQNVENMRALFCKHGVNLKHPASGGCTVCGELGDVVDSALNSIPAAPAKAQIPEGWKMAPVTLSPGMIEAFWELIPSGINKHLSANLIWEAMINAAPKPPTEGA